MNTRLKVWHRVVPAKVLLLLSKRWSLHMIPDATYLWVLGLPPLPFAQVGLE